MGGMKEQCDACEAALRMRMRRSRQRKLKRSKRRRGEGVGGGCDLKVSDFLTRRLVLLPSGKKRKEVLGSCSERCKGRHLARGAPT